MSCYSCLRHLLFAVPPEAAHRAAILALRGSVAFAPEIQARPELAIACFGLRFPSPLGMAAGFDKNAEVFAPLLAQGFGFVEVGTVTPRPQEGNPRPRMFRLVEDEAVINRLGFNGEGMEAVRRRLEMRKRQTGIVGVNIGKNKDTEYALADYLALLRELGGLADYVTVNISSPNTVGLRDLQRRDAFLELLSALIAERNRQNAQLPLLVKIAPDMTPAEMEDVAEIALECGIDGLIVGNTTVSRPESLRSGYKAEGGGLSGRPLAPLATEALRRMYRLTQGKIPLVGVGGIASPEDAIARIRAGATLIQLYTALVYQGFGLVARIHAGLAAEVKRTGVKNLAELVGTEE